MATNNTSNKEKWILKLYVTGMSAKTKEAIQRVRDVCEQHLKDRYDLEIIDLYQHPGKAKEAQIIAAPTLIRQMPMPIRKIIGDMTNKEKLLKGLEISINKVR